MFQTIVNDKENIHDVMLIEKGSLYACIFLYYGWKDMIPWICWRYFSQKKRVVGGDRWNTIGKNVIITEARCWAHGDSL